MKIRMPVTLRSRLSLFNAVFLSGILLASLVLVYFVLQTWLYHQVDNSLTEMARQVSAQIIISKKGIAYKEFLPSNELEKQRQFVRIVDTDGRVVEHWGPLEHLPTKIIAGDKFPLKGSFLEETMPNDDEPLMVYTLPVVSAGKTAGFIQSGQSLEPIENMLQMLIATLLILAPITFLTTLLTSRWITGRALAPLAGIAATAERISEQELRMRLDIQGEDEVARLATSLDRMLDRLEDAFEGYRQFTGDASHELRTPLTIMKGEISLALQKERDTTYYKEVLEDIEEEVDRLIRMVEQLLFLARADGEKIQTAAANFDLSEVLPPLLEQMEVLAAARHQQLTWKIPSQIFVSTDPDVVQQILVNLLDNAIKYTPEHQKIAVTVENLPDVIRIFVADSGPGIAKEHLDHIFDRFYRVDKGRSRELGGTGLGLAIAKQLAHFASVNIRVTSEIGKGTTFSLDIPAS